MYNQFALPFLGIHFQLPKFVFFIGDYAVTWNLFFMLLGIVAAIFFFWQTARKQKSDKDVYIIAAVSLIVGFFAARIIGVPLTQAASLYNAQTAYYSDFLSMLDFGDGNMPIYIGIIFGIITAKWMCKSKKKMFSDFSDSIVFALLGGQIIGRLGDFFAQSYIGMPTHALLGLQGTMIDKQLESMKESILASTPTALNIPYNPGAAVHPLSIYEIMACIIIILVLGMVKKKQFFRGELFLGYLTLYGGIRAILETSRIDILPFGLLRPYQVIGAVSFVAGAIAWAVLRWQTKEGNLKAINLYRDTVHDDGYGNQKVKKQHAVYTATENEKFRTSMVAPQPEIAPKNTSKKGLSSERIEADLAAVNAEPVVYTADDDEKLENIADTRSTPVKPVETDNSNHKE